MDMRLRLSTLSYRFLSYLFTVNPYHSKTLARNTIKNPKNDGHCMAVTTRGGKKIVDPIMSSIIESDMINEKEVVEDIGEFVDNTVKEVKISQKVVQFPTSTTIPLEISEKN